MTRSGWTVMTVGAALALSGCGFGGVNSLPLPGAVGRGPDASTYHLQFTNIGTLEQNSPVLVNDVVVGRRRHEVLVGVGAVAKDVGLARDDADATCILLGCLGPCTSHLVHRGLFGDHVCSCAAVEA